MLSHMPLGDEINNFFGSRPPKHFTTRCDNPEAFFYFPPVYHLPSFFFDGRESPHVVGGKPTRQQHKNRGSPTEGTEISLGDPLFRFPLRFLGCGFFAIDLFTVSGTTAHCFFSIHHRKKGKWEFVITPKSPFLSLFFLLRRQRWKVGPTPRSAVSLSAHTVFFSFFHCTVKSANFCRRKLPLASEPIDSCPTVVDTKTASTSVLKRPLGGETYRQTGREELLLLLLLLSTIDTINFRLSTCYFSQDQHRRCTLDIPAHAGVSSRRSAPPYTSYTSSALCGPQNAYFYHDGKKCDRGRQGFGVIHFRYRSLRQVGCYTFHSGFRPSWPPPNSKEQTMAF